MPPPKADEGFFCIVVPFVWGSKSSSSFMQGGMRLRAHQRARKTDEVCDRPLETFGALPCYLIFIGSFLVSVPFVLPSNNTIQATWEVTAEGVKGATGKPPCRRRSGDSPCNKKIKQQKRKKQTALLTPARGVESPTPYPRCPPPSAVQDTPAPDTHPRAKIHSPQHRFQRPSCLRHSQDSPAAASRPHPPALAHTPMTRPCPRHQRASPCHPGIHTLRRFRRGTLPAARPKSRTAPSHTASPACRPPIPTRSPSA